MRSTITLFPRSGTIEFISVFALFAGSEKHLKFPVVGNEVQDVPVYKNIYPPEFLREVMDFAQSAIDNETYDDIA